MNRIFKDDVDNILKDMYVTSEMKSKIKEKAYSGNNKRIISFSKVAVCVAAIFAFSACVIGATSIFEKVKEKLGNTYETGILQAIPPKENAVCNNVSIDTAAAMTDGNSAVAYIVIDDKETVKRIDDTAQISDLNINLVEGNNSMGYTVESVGYDKNKDTVIMKLSIDGKNLENKEISLEASDIMSELESQSYNTKGYKISDIVNENATFIKADKGAYNTEEGTVEEYTMLKPDEINIPINNDKTIYISNCVIKDGKLYIQYKYKAEIPNQGVLYFRFNDGVDDYYGIPEVLRNFSVSENGDICTDDTESKNGWYYTENIFYIDNISQSKNEFLNTTLFTEYDYYKNVVRGNWNISFKVEKLQHVYEGKCNLDINGAKITSYSLSPIGITLRGYSENENISMYDIDPVIVVNGKKIQAYGTSSSEWTFDEYKNMEENIAFKYSFSNVTDISKAEKIILGNKEIIVEKN